MQCRSVIFSPYNIDLKETWLTLDLEEDSIKNSRHEPIIAPDNNNQPQSKPHVQEIQFRDRESAYELHKCPVSEVVFGTSQLKKVGFVQQLFNRRSGIPS